MTQQLSLLDARPKSLVYPRTLDDRFAAWARANGHVVALFVRYALDAHRAGAQRIGAKAVAERIRWYAAVETRDPEGFKINNSYVSRLARLAVDTHPELLGLFEMRALNH